MQERFVTESREMMAKNKTVRLGDPPTENKRPESLFVLTVLLFFAGRGAGKMLISICPQWSGTVDTAVIHLCTAAVMIPYTLTTLIRRDMLLRDRRNTGEMVFFFITALAVILAADSLISLLARLWGGGAAAGFGGASGMSAAATAGSPVLMFAVYAVCVPVTEELVFRGVFFIGIRCRYSFVTAALLSSVLFALMHGIGLAAAAALVTGIVLCYVYEKTGHLIVPVLVHAANNIIALIVMK